VRVVVIVFVLLSCACTHAALFACVMAADVADKQYFIPVLRGISILLTLFGVFVVFLLEGRVALGAGWLRLAFIAALLSPLMCALKGLAGAFIHAVLLPERAMIMTFFSGMDFVKYFVAILLLLGAYRGLWLIRTRRRR
jgi:hypothetical protein